MSVDDRAARLETILDHFQNPHNHGRLADADISLEGGNPGCGDRVTIYLKMDGERIRDISFEGEGCTISQSSASILTDRVCGKTIGEIEQMDYQMLEDELGEELVKTRPRCATLGLDTLKATLEAYRKNVDRHKA